MPVRVNIEIVDQPLDKPVRPGPELAGQGAEPIVVERIGKGTGDGHHERHHHGRAKNRENDVDEKNRKSPFERSPAYVCKNWHLSP